MRAVDEYYAALERLKKNKPTNVPRGSAINKDTVALEAGKKRGSIRNRSGFEQLIADIAAAAAAEKKTKRTTSELAKENYAAKEQEIEALKEENDVLKTRYMSLLYQNYELQNIIAKHGIKVPKFGTAQSISVIEESPK